MPAWHRKQGALLLFSGPITLGSRNYDSGAPDSDGVGCDDDDDDGDAPPKLEFFFSFFYCWGFKFQVYASGNNVRTDS